MARRRTGNGGKLQGAVLEIVAALGRIVPFGTPAPPPPPASRCVQVEVRDCSVLFTCAARAAASLPGSFRTITRSLYSGVGWRGWLVGQPVDGARVEGPDRRQQPGWPVLRIGRCFTQLDGQPDRRTDGRTGRGRPRVGGREEAGALLSSPLREAVSLRAVAVARRVGLFFSLPLSFCSVGIARFALGFLSILSRFSRVRPSRGLQRDRHRLRP